MGSYKDMFQNAMDMKAGNQSQIRPSDPSEQFRRMHGISNEPLVKAISMDKECKMCGTPFKPKEDRDKRCPNCDRNFKMTKWHKGDLA